MKHKCEYCGEEVKEEIVNGVLTNIKCTKCGAEFQVLD